MQMQAPTKPRDGVRTRIDKQGRVTYQANFQTRGSDGKPVRFWSPPMETRAQAIVWREDLKRKARQHQVIVRETGLLFRELVERYIASERHNWSPFTERYYRQTLLGSACKQFHEQRVFTIRGPDLQAFINAKSQEGKAPGTVNKLYQAMSAAFSWAVRMDLLEVNPMERVKRAKARREEPQRVLRLHELQGFLCYAGRRWLYYLTLALTGLRRSEAARMTWDWIDFDEGMLRVRHGKTGYDEIPLPDVLLAELKAARPEGAEGFVFSANGAPLRIEGRRRRALEAAGVDPAGIGEHTFRRTYSTLLERVPGVVYSSVKALMRHSHLGRDITARYLRPPDEDLRAAINGLASMVVGV